MEQATIGRHARVSPGVTTPESEAALPRTGIGHFVTLLNDDGAVTRFVLTDARCRDALARVLGKPSAVLATRDPLGRAILDREVGDRCRYEDGGESRSVWVMAIEPGPVL